MNTLLHTLEEIPPWEKALAIAGIITAFWGHIAAIGRAFVRLFVVTVRTDLEIATAVTSFVRQNGGRQYSTLPLYGSFPRWIKKLQRNQDVAEIMTYISSGLLIDKRWRPMWLHYDVDSDTHGGYEHSISYFRGTIDWNKLCHEALLWSADRRHSRRNRFAVTYHHGKSAAAAIEDAGNSLDEMLKKQTFSEATGRVPIGFSFDELGRTQRVDALEDLTLPPNVKAMIARVLRWLTSKQWYFDHHIPWRQGFLLHGRPGTGKTSTLRALAESHDLPIHVMDIATLTNSELREAWSEAVERAPCIILIEDIDGVFDERTNVGTGSLTFDALLNCIDGVEQANGVLLFVTTNNLDMVDDALQNRPGRIDAVVEFTYPDEDGRAAIAGRFVDERRARQIARDYPDASPAKVVEVCCREAVAEHFAEGGARDDAGATAVELKPEVERKR